MCVKIINDREYFYQYDINQKMVVCDRNAKELHFTNEVLNVAYVRDIYDAENIRLCDIPNIILTYGGYLKVYACYEDYTQKEYTFIVNERNKPEDYVDEEYNERFILLTDRVGYLEKKTKELESEFVQLSEAIKEDGDGSKYLSDDGTYKTIVVEQSDYTENDETSPAYIKNRPVIYNENYIYINCPLGSSDNGIANTYVLFSNENQNRYTLDNIIVGETYHITFYKDDKSISYEGVGSENNTIIYNDLTIGNNGVWMIWEAYELVGENAYMTIENGAKYEIHDDYLDAFQSDYNETDETSPRYIHNKPNFTLAPYVIDSEAYTYGDDALQAILDGRQIYIKVPNADTTNSIFVNYMPVVQYQLPTGGNNYLILFYMKDGIATNIMTALSTGDFSGVFGAVTMMLSNSYIESPLAIDPVK